MSELMHGIVSPTVAGAVMAFSAAVAAGPIHWPVQGIPGYVVPQIVGTYSFANERIEIVVPKVGTAGFAKDIAEIYAAFTEGQEPLGRDFEAVWDANVAVLYEG